MNRVEAVLLIVASLIAFALGFTHGVLSGHIDAKTRGRPSMSTEMHRTIDETGLDRRW